LNEAIDTLMVFSGRLNTKMANARERCKQISESEKLLGFTDTADLYREISEEVNGLALWVHQEENRMLRDGEIDSASEPEDILNQDY
jgi:hypothetical protein